MVRPDYSAVLRDLKARRAKLDTAIEAIEQILGSGEIETAPGASTEIRSDTFYAMSIIEATKKFLAMDTRPKAANEIADALERGGLINESKNFTNTVYTSLRREDQKKGDIISLPDRKWGLTDRYPEAARRRAAGGDSQKPATPPSDPASDPAPIEPEQPSEQSQPGVSP
jgi:hypothetical protein